MSLHTEEGEENIPVKQRMDAVITGLIGGGTASLLLVVGGLVALYSGIYEKFTGPNVVFAWLSVLSALTIGQLVITYTVITTFSEAPSQTEKGVVQ